MSVRNLIMCTCLGLEVSLCCLAAEGAYETPEWQLGQSWRVKVRRYTLEASLPVLGTPVFWDYLVIEEAIVDGVEAWGLAVFQDRTLIPYGVLFVRKSDLQALRWEGYGRRRHVTQDFVADGAGRFPVACEDVLPPLGLPVFEQDEQERVYEYVPVINGLWGFPTQVSQTASDMIGAFAVTLRLANQRFTQVWPRGCPWWQLSERDGFYIAETVAFNEPFLDAHALTGLEPCFIQRSIRPPAGRWWPLSGQASAIPWSAGTDGAAGTSDAGTLGAANPIEQADVIPWSGYWWRFADYGDPNVNTYAPGGLLYKYDEYYKVRRGSYPSPEKARDLEFRLYRLDPTDPNAGWFGHCNGWCSAALRQAEPRATRTVAGIAFDVGDRKGLLSEAYIGADASYPCGDRYRGPGDDPDDPSPYDFHRTIVSRLGVEREAIVFDVNRFEAVWNHPAYRYEMSTQRDPSIGNRLHVTCNVWYADDGVHADFVGTQAGISAIPLTGPLGYRYYLTVDSSDNPVIGQSAWEAPYPSVPDAFRNPDFAWVPEGEPLSGSDRTHNTALDWSIIQEVACETWLSEPVNWRVDYGNNWNKSGTVTKPGATRIRLHFSTISTESSWDHLRTNAGNDWSGSFTNVTSAEKSGNAMGLTLTSDGSVTGYFIIDRVEYQGTSTGAATKSGQVFQ